MRKGILLTDTAVHYPALDSGGRIVARTSLAPDPASAPPNPPFSPSEPPPLLPSELEPWLYREGIPADRLALARQVHGAAVQYVDRPGVYEGIDGFFTDRPGLWPGIRTADCLAVMVSFPEIPAVGIAHAGWRGLRSGIVPRLLDQMRRRWPVNPENIRIAVSPHIRQCCYEVGEEFTGYFPPEALHFWNGRWFFSQEAALLIQLARWNIPRRNLIISPLCTHCSEVPLYSYRKNRTAGRLLSVIGIRENAPS
ncbi:MAG: laccase domain-containing protein [Calditrichaeota bacterium]|nr:MAG: laccase domain-containing protein [Calditrichota bacterium]